MILVQARSFHRLCLVPADDGAPHPVFDSKHVQQARRVSVFLGTDTALALSIAGLGVCLPAAFNQCAGVDRHHIGDGMGGGKRGDLQLAHPAGISGGGERHADGRLTRKRCLTLHAVAEIGAGGEQGDDEKRRGDNQPGV